MTRAPILVVGVTQRSGTNHLHQLLGLHPDVAAPRTIREDYRPRAPPRSPPVRAIAGRYVPDWIPPHEAEAQLLARVGDALLDWLAADAGLGPDDPRRLLTKTPGAYGVRGLAALAPGAHLVLLVRDGRDVVASGMRGLGWRFTEGVDTWLAGAREFLRLTGRPLPPGVQVRTVRYEDLVADPVAEVTDLLTWLGLDPDRWDADAARTLPVVGVVLPHRGAPSRCTGTAARPAASTPAAGPTRGPPSSRPVRPRAATELRAFGYPVTCRATASPRGGPRPARSSAASGAPPGGSSAGATDVRVLTVMNLYPPHAFGGYEDLCAGAVADWRAAGHDVRVLTSDWRRARRARRRPAPRRRAGRPCPADVLGRPPAARPLAHRRGPVGTPRAPGAGRGAGPRAARRRGRVERRGAVVLPVRPRPRARDPGGAGDPRPVARVRARRRPLAGSLPVGRRRRRRGPRPGDGPRPAPHAARPASRRPGRRLLRQPAPARPRPCHRPVGLRRRGDRSPRARRHPLPGPGRRRGRPALAGAAAVRRAAGPREGRRHRHPGRRGGARGATRGRRHGPGRPSRPAARAGRRARRRRPGHLRRRAGARRPAGRLPRRRRGRVPVPVGRALRGRAAGGHGQRGAGAGHRHRRVRRVPRRRVHLPAVRRGRRRRPGRRDRPAGGRHRPARAAASARPAGGRPPRPPRGQRRAAGLAAARRRRPGRSSPAERPVLPLQLG